MWIEREIGGSFSGVSGFFATLCGMDFFFRVCVRCLGSGLAWRQGTKILDVGGRGFFIFGVNVFGLFGFA